MLDEVDFNAFYELLLDTTRKAFRWAQEAYPNETFYVFGLYHHGWLDYVFPTCNTEEGLLDVCQDLENQKMIEDCWLTARWSPCDWKYHEIGTEIFEDVSQWMSAFGETIRAIDQALVDSRREDADERIGDLYAECENRMIAITRSVLKTLDEEKLFGEGEARERIVLNIMEGDQGPDWIEHCRLLNPDVTYKRWLAEVDAGYKAAGLPGLFE